MSLAEWTQLALKVCYRAASYLRGIKLLLVIRASGGRCDGVPRVDQSVMFKYPPHEGVTIGKNCSIGPFCIFDVPPGGVLSIGDNVKITGGAVISAIQSVEIGDDCLIAEWVSIRDAQHRYKIGEPIRLQGLDIGSIVLGRDVWVGRSSAVFMNSYLESGCVVGANSIVKGKRLAENSVYGGNPIRELKSRVDP